MECHAGRKRPLANSQSTSAPRRTWVPVLEPQEPLQTDVEQADLKVGGGAEDEDVGRKSSVEELGIALKRMGIPSTHSLPEVPAQSASICRHSPAQVPLPVYS